MALGARWDVLTLNNLQQESNSWALGSAQNELHQDKIECLLLQFSFVLLS